MNLEGLSQTDFLSRCSWCHRVIPADQECFGFGARVRPEGKPQLVGKEGKAVSLGLATGRNLIAIVPAVSSDARTSGDDVFFQACSTVCCDEMSAALKDEFFRNA
jgi:hypothetical protein